MNAINRVPAGVRAGGQFAESLRAEADAGALTGSQSFEPTGIENGSNTPWGEADHVESVADGIDFVSTASHGGYKLSRDRNATIPPVFRQRSGWYEEDCQRHIVEHFCAEETGSDAESALERLKWWYPTSCESHFGICVPDAQRNVADRSDDDTEKIRIYGTPEDRARRAERQAAAKDAARAEHQSRWRYPGFTTELTAADEKALSKMTSRGQTLGQMIEAGVPGKLAYFDGTSMRYQIEDPDDPNSVWPVGKRVWQKVAAPDTRTLQAQQRHEREHIGYQLDQLMRAEPSDPVARSKWRDKVESLRNRHRKLEAGRHP